MAAPSRLSSHAFGVLVLVIVGSLIAPPASAVCVVNICAAGGVQVDDSLVEDPPCDGADPADDVQDAACCSEDSIDSAVGTQDSPWWDPSTVRVKVEETGFFHDLFWKHLTKVSVTVVPIPGAGPLQISIAGLFHLIGECLLSTKATAEPEENPGEVKFTFVIKGELKDLPARVKMILKGPSLSGTWKVAQQELQIR